mmetsp:Transcript_25854/g.55292  ORF Transcript_25854/g.55292 Transcript_25854/m.55292 type:complete len:88 (-) Transcript_25854:80-343(-)
MACCQFAPSRELACMPTVWGQGLNGMPDMEYTKINRVFLRIGWVSHQSKNDAPAWNPLVSPFWVAFEDQIIYSDLLRFQEHGQTCCK